MAERFQRDTKKEKSRDFRIDQEPDEILRLMEANLGGNQNYQLIGSGWLAYKAGELNSKATGSLTFATWILAFVSGVLALFTVLQFTRM
jgi:hypothetical protein